MKCDRHNVYYNNQWIIQWIINHHAFEPYDKPSFLHSNTKRSHSVVLPADGQPKMSAQSPAAQCDSTRA